MQDIQKYVNQDEALNRIRGNKTLYKKLLQSFMGDTLMDTLIADVERGDLQAAAKSAHAIKGASANLSLTKLNESIKLLESGLKAGSCDKNVFDACVDAFDKTKEAVNEILNHDE